MAPLNIRAILPILTLSLLTWSCGSQPAVDEDVPTIILVATGNVNNEVGPCG